jgi:polar amino acid transport system substrate-binding protein
MHRPSFIFFAIAAAIVVASTTTALSQNLLERAKAKGEVVCGVELQSAPLEFTEQGEAKGYSVELLKLVSQEMGLKFRYVDVPFPSLLPGLDTGKFDMSCSSVTVTKARLEKFYYSLPVAEGSVGLIKMKKDAAIKSSADIAGKVVGAAKGTSMLKLLQDYAKTLPGGVKEIREYIDYNQGYADMLAGRIVAMANPLPNILYAAKQRSDTFEVLLPAFGPKAYLGWMVRNNEDSKPLMDEVNKALAKINASGKMEELQEKWLGVKLGLPADKVPTPLY